LVHLPAKARLDVHAVLGTTHVIADLKTAAGDIGEAEWQWTVRRYAYNVQLAWYMRGAARCGMVPWAGKNQREPLAAGWWIAQEKEGPYEAALYEMGPVFHERARDYIDATLATLATCIEQDNWPGRVFQTV
jgi:hypothetical protein